MPELVDLVFNLPLKRRFTYSCDEPVGMGARVSADFAGRVITGFVVGRPETPPAGQLKKLGRVIDREPLFDEEYLKLAAWLAEMYLCSFGEALFAMVPGGRRESAQPGLAADQDFLEPASLDLSDEQSAALRELSSAASGTFYLHGITGSGKTEVFLRAAERTMAEGRSVIYLVPEIALTAQVSQAIAERFPRGAAVLHSRLTQSQRLGEWRRVQRGEASLVVGARSAIFAPVRRLGLVVIDEEHEGSYKSSAAPRYHARQVAMHRCVTDGALLVMGSATPSVEAFHLMRRGVFRPLRLTRRLAGGSLPRVEIVRLMPEDGIISPRLREAVLETHRRGRQTILFLNRRGFAHFFHCRSCGFEMTCKRCSVGLTYHKQRGSLVCHYCGYRTAPVRVCPSCGSLDTGYGGFGTERIEEETRRLFPELRVARIDTDAVRARGALEKALEDFRCARTDLLLGTQMVAKGLNFPGVDLVGIVLADSGLHLPDFRAAERTFALITQVSGRAGRFSDAGRVIIQTYLPDNDAIRLAAGGDEQGFYERELETRRAQGFPPFSRLFRLVLRGARLEVVEREVARLGRAVRAAVGQAAELLGPAECPIGVIAGKHRFQLIVRTTAFVAAHAALAGVLTELRLPTGVNLEVDVDPVSLL